MINILATGLQEVFKAIWGAITSKDALVVYIAFLLVLIIIVVIRVLTFDTTRVDTKNDTNVEEIRKTIASEVDKLSSKIDETTTPDSVNVVVNGLATSTNEKGNSVVLDEEEQKELEKVKGDEKSRFYMLSQIDA